MEVQIFNNPEFGQIRSIEIDRKPYFMASDIAKALGYSRPNDAVSAHCRATVKRSSPISGKMQEVNYISEGDMYRLITHSKLESAERFEAWIFDEVLPSIRKHGAYMTESAIEQALTSPDFLIRLATKLKEEQEKNRKLTEDNARMKPKEIFADAVSASDTSILIGDLAKLLKQNGYETGQKRLFEKLRSEGYLIRQKGASYNMPTQKSMERKLFDVKESVLNNPDGTVRINRTVKVTGKGQQYFINKFLAAENAK